MNNKFYKNYILQIVWALFFISAILLSLYLYLDNLTTVDCSTFLEISEFSETNEHLVLVSGILTLAFFTYTLKTLVTAHSPSPVSHGNGMNKFETIEVSADIRNFTFSLTDSVKNLIGREYRNKLLVNHEHTDDLTSLYTHRYFHQIMKQNEYSYTSSLSVIILDIDKFKVVNDTYGYVVGDRILKNIGEILLNSMSESLKGFRYGGEEFVIVAENYTLDEAYLLAEDLRSQIIRSRVLQSQCDNFPITVSVGVAAYPEQTKSPEDLIDKADRAMYFAKQNGRNQTCIYNENIEEILIEKSEVFRKKEVLLDSALAFVAAVDAKDNYTGGHSEMVTKYSLLLAEKIGLSEEDKYLLRIGALLHDCGKIGIPDNIIGKKGRLTLEEYRIIKDHPLLGNNILKYIIEDESVMSCVRNHHEKWDGSGYPDALSGEEISLHARIVTLADAFHAMTSDRPYRRRLSFGTAITELRDNSGTQFDPSLVEGFIEAVYDFHGN